MPLPRQTRLTPARPGDAAFHLSGPGAPAAPAPARSRSQAPRRGAPRGRAAAPQARPAFPRRRTPRRTAHTSRHRPTPPQRQQPETESGCRPGGQHPGRAGRAPRRADSPGPLARVRRARCNHGRRRTLRTGGEAMPQSSAQLRTQHLCWATAPAPLTGAGAAGSLSGTASGEVPAHRHTPLGGTVRPPGSTAS